MRYIIAVVTSQHTHTHTHTHVHIHIHIHIHMHTHTQTHKRWPQMTLNSWSTSAVDTGSLLNGTLCCYWSISYIQCHKYDGKPALTTREHRKAYQQLTMVFNIQNNLVTSHSILASFIVKLSPVITNDTILYKSPVT